MRANHHFNGLFEVKTDEVALREQLVMTKTDKIKGIFAKDKMRVKAIDQTKGLVTLVNQEKHNHVILDKNDLATLHWDYALTTTTRSAQGADKPFAVVAHKSTSPLANIRSMYVGLSRGQRHIKVFTDNRKAFLNKIKTEFRDNTIAVNKVTGEITLTEYFDRYKAEKQAARSGASNTPKASPDKGFAQTPQTVPDYDHYIPVDDSHADVEGLDEYLANQGSLSAPQTGKAIPNQKQTSATPKTKETAPTIKQPKAKESNKYAHTVFSKKIYDPRYLDDHGRFDIRKYGAEVAQELKKYTESVSQQLLGQPNKSHSDHKVMAYGKKNGSLKITLNGKWRGHYKDWSSGDRGDMLTLLMRETGMSYADAVAEGAKMVSMPEAFSIKETKNHDKLIQERTDKQKKSYDNAVKLWNKTHPVNSTLAEKYLKQHRGIEDHKGADVRFHTGVYSTEVKDKYQPALVVQFKDKDGKLTGVESIYLERKTAKKMSHLKVPKRSYGTKKGSSVLINPGRKERNVTLIAEGVVTALSVKQAFKDDHILAVGGKENFPNIHPDSVKDHVILCADNDGIDPKQDRALIKTINALEKAGKHVAVVIPKSIKGLEKSDYNDTLKQGGVKAVFDHIQPVYQNAARQEGAINNMINQGVSQANNMINERKYSDESLNFTAPEIEKYIQDVNKNESAINKSNLDYSKNLEAEKENVMPDQHKNKIIKPQLTK